MPIHVKWHNEEKTIILIEFEGTWDLDDHIKMLSESRSMTNTIEHDFITMVDFTKSATPPSRMLSMGSKMEAVEGTHLPITNIMVGMGRLNELMLGIINRIYPKAVKDFELVSTLEDGLALAHKKLAKAKTQDQSRQQD